MASLFMLRQPAEPTDGVDTDAASITEITDDALMVRYARGDKRAFEPLYRRHRLSLFRYFVHGTGDEPTAEELYQDVWTKLINARGTYRSTAKFTTYLYGIASNTLTDYYRRRAVRDNSVHKIATPSSSPMLEDELDSARILGRLSDALQRLPLEQRSAFLLQRETGFSVAELADICNTGVETMKSRLRHAVRKLRMDLRSDHD
jgi:RNA polymerase sigma-70 factor (ECF subfamily)|tara:strand:- start:1047 stop:1658 length:612 start_codon:yes stop_codon:yes gene_type:complete